MEMAHEDDPRGKGLWSIVTGEEMVPDDVVEDVGEDILKYQHTERLAYIIICLSLGDGLAEEVQHAQTPKEVWDMPSKTYESRNLANVLRLKRVLLVLKMRSGERIKDYIQKVGGIDSQLNAVGEPVPKSELAFTLLNSLPASYWW